MTADELRQAVRDDMRATGMTQLQYAEHYGIRQYDLSKFLSGKIGPGSVILSALGYKRITTYVKEKK